MSFIPLLSIVLSAFGPSPRIGLAINVPEGGGEEEFLSAARQQIRMGLDGAAASIKWDEYESQNGKPLMDGLGLMKLTGQEGMVTIATLDTVKRRLPPDVANLAWDDPALLARWERFLSDLGSKLDKRIHFVSLGNEVDGYLSQRPGELEPYRRFLAAGRATLKKLKPDLQVGVTVMCMEALKQKDLARRLQVGMDTTIFTYYPSMGPLSAKNPESIASHFEFMAGIAGSRPLLLQEIGFPASPQAGGSEEKQAEFVRLVFQQLDKHAAKIPLAVFFMQCDFPPSLLGILETYYGLSGEPFRAFLGSLGFMDSKGRARPAWKVFQQEVAKRKPM